DPAAARATREGGDPGARADRTVPGPQRRAAPGAHAFRAGAALSGRGNDRGRPGGPHTASGAAAGAPEPDAARSARADRNGRGVAAAVVRPARPPDSTSPHPTHSPCPALTTPSHHLSQ